MSGAASAEYLESEIAAWPLASVSAFRLGLDSLERTGSGTLAPATEDLSGALLEHLQSRSQGQPLGVFYLMRDGIWFDVPEPAPEQSGRRKLSMSGFLFLSTRNRLEFSGERVLLHTTPERPLEEAVHRWRWSSFSLPDDLFIAAHAAQTHQEPLADHVTLGAPELDRFFADTPLAQPHLHLGAAIPFERLWTNLMTRVGTEELSPQGLGGHAGFDSSREFLCWLVTAALARLALASFLCHREAGRAERFGEFLPRLAARSRRQELVLTAMTALSQGRGPLGFAEARGVLRRLARAPPVAVSSEPLDAMARRDPLFEWLGPGRALPETRFMTRGLRFLQETPDEGFARLFWQYLRIRHLTYRHLVLAPGTRGLDWFSSHFQKIQPLRIGLDVRDRVSSALELESRGARLASLEVRTSPSARWNEIRDLALQVRDAPALPGRDAARGLVLHFLKEVHTHRQDQLANADPRQRAHGCRFGAYFHARHQESTAIETALRRHPRLLEVFRGMDVCHLELAVPTWVFIPLLTRLRAASAQVARAAGRGLQPLRLTMHVGEEFRRLGEGLRRVHEPVEFGLIQPGDRLGHAVALGLEPGTWCHENPLTRQPREEHLDDLLWELARYHRSEMAPVPGRMLYVEQQLARLGSLIYGENPSASDLLAARELRYNPAFLDAVGYPFMRRPFHSEEWGQAGALARRFLTDFGVHERGHFAERVTTHRTDALMLEQAQAFLRRVLADGRVTVEANPTSNMLIGGVRLEQHPIFRLQPLRGQPPTGGALVPVALGSDDPVTLATCLPNEFTYVYFELVRGGAAPADALEWLIRIAGNGMQARFTT